MWIIRLPPTGSEVRVPDLSVTSVVDGNSLSSGSLPHMTQCDL